MGNSASTQGQTGRAARRVWRIPRAWAPWLILAIGLVTTAAVTAGYWRTVREKDEDRFENNLEQATDTIRDRLHAYLALVRGVGGLFAADPSVSREEFQDCVRELGLDRHYRGIQGFGFVRRVAPGERETFAAQQRQSGAAGFTVRTEAPSDDESFPIVYLEPPDRRNAFAIGYDMHAERVRREAMELARDAGEPQMSAAVELVQEIDAQKQMGFLVFLPVYSPGVRPATVEERRERLVGFVYASFRGGDLFEGIFGSETHPRLDIEIVDGADPERGVVLHDTRGGREPGYVPRIIEHRRLDFAGRAWTLGFSTRPRFEFASGVRETPLLALCGAGISLLLFGISSAQVRARAEAERAAGLWRRAEERYATTLASIGDGVIATDPEGRVTFVNPVAAALTGWSPEEALRQDVAAVVRTLDEDRRDPLESPVARVLRGEAVPAPGVRALLVRRDGRELVIDAGAAPIRGVRGAIEGAVLVFRDVSERRAVEAELARHRDHLEELVEERTRALEESHHKLRLSERMASLGTLSAGLGHDMGNLLLPVRIRLDALAATASTPERREEISVVRRCVEYLQRLSNGLRLFALDPERGTTGGEATSLADWWGDVEAFFRSVLPRGVELGCELSDELPPVRVARHALTQAVFNLVQNAGDAMRSRGRGRIVVHAARDGATVRLSVEDDGPGMSAEVRRRCLEPFFTTKTREISTGLGLALVHAIVAKAGGTVEIDSEPGRGTRFTLLLPVAGERADGPREPGAARAGVALLEVGDARLASFLAVELERSGFAVKGRASLDGEEHTLWVADDSALAVPEALERFLASRPRRKVLWFGERPAAVDPQRVRVLPRTLKPSAIREALRDLARSVQEASTSA